MVIINRLVFLLINPSAIAVALLVLGWIFLHRSRLLSRTAYVLAAIWIYAWTTTPLQRWLGSSLEGFCPPVLAEASPTADAIVVLGGGMDSAPGVLPYPELQFAADRAWHGARLWLAGRAPVVVTSGAGSKDSDAVFINALGVPSEKILVDNDSRNTEENAKFVARMIDDIRKAAGRTDAGRKPRVLLVTSAWHMRRSVLMYMRYAPGFEIVPVGSDYEFTLLKAHPMEFRDFLPSVDCLYRSNVLWKELLGYWGYRLLRK